MFEAHREEFMKFMLLNNAYGQEKRAFKEQFDTEGVRIQQIILDWEDKLCRQMEGGKHGQFSSKLGEKFQEEVLKYFPYYHEIGMKMTFASQ